MSGVEILHDVSLVVEPGELVVIAGGSGARKTSLLEALSGIGPADSGRVRFDGVDTYRHFDQFRTILGYVSGLDRLPAANESTYASLAVTLAVEAAAALALGLLASAAVSSPSQATLTLPMLCFPAVLFSGAIIPVPVMAWIGRAMSVGVPDRWAFEAIGVDLGVRNLFENGVLR